MNFNVLLVEDNDSYRQALVDTLRSRFASTGIEGVDSGEKALTIAEDHHLDMIFMDISLPGDNGLEVTRKIKMRYEHTRIIILTSHDIPEYRQQAYRNGADYFISKSDNSCLPDIITWVEKTMAKKHPNLGSPRASCQAFLRQRMSGTIASFPNVGLDLSACLL